MVLCCYNGSRGYLDLLVGYLTVGGIGLEDGIPKEGLFFSTECLR
jgi:hypothetical protein